MGDIYVLRMTSAGDGCDAILFDKSDRDSSGYLDRAGTVSCRTICFSAFAVMRPIVAAGMGVGIAKIPAVHDQQ